MAGLKAITLDDVKRFYAEHYTRGNAVVALGGGYPQELVERFEATLAKLPGGRRQARRGAARRGRSRGAQVRARRRSRAPTPRSASASRSTSRRGEPDFYAALARQLLARRAPQQLEPPLPGDPRGPRPQLRRLLLRRGLPRGRPAPACRRPTSAAQPAALRGLDPHPAQRPGASSPCAPRCARCRT